MKEYLILHEEAINIQKKLNQWRHEYKIEILGIAKDDITQELILILTRERVIENEIS